MHAHDVVLVEVGGDLLVPHLPRAEEGLPKRLAEECVPKRACRRVRAEEGLPKSACRRGRLNDP
jgi:hypothetical protein